MNLSDITARARSIGRETLIRWVAQPLVVGLAGAAGAVGVYYLTPPRVETEILALSETCREQIDAGFDFEAAVTALEHAETRRAKTGDVYVDSLYEGSVSDIEEAKEAVDEAQQELKAAEATFSVARSRLVASDNQCFTDVQAIRGELP